MGTAAARNKRTTTNTGDPVVDKLAVFDARQKFYGSVFSMGWRLAVTVLVPIIVGVQLDKRFDTKPSLTLAAFFIALFGSAWLIYQNYVSMQREQFIEDQKKTKRTNRKLKRSSNA